jgi:hypothetical protein
MGPRELKIADILKVENSFITLLARHKSDVNKYGIVYRYPGEEKSVQLFSPEFAFLYKRLVSDFQVGFTTGAIVGLARERTPADVWRSDTIERSIKDKNSIYRGILRIIDEEDGIPVFMHSTCTIGNIAPALAYFQRGNPLEIQRALDRYNVIQKSIVAKILAGKPRKPKEVLVAADLVGDGLKSDSRARAISRALDALNFSPKL